MCTVARFATTIIDIKQKFLKRKKFLFQSTVIQLVLTFASAAAATVTATAAAVRFCTV